MRHFEYIIVPSLDLDLRSDDVTPEVQGVPPDGETLFLLDLLGIDRLERKAVEIPEERRDIELEGDPVLLESLRLDV